MKLLEILNLSKEYLEKYSFSKPRLECEKLISSILKLDRIILYAYHDMEISEEQKEVIRRYLKEMVKQKKGFDELMKSQEELGKELGKEFYIDTKDYKEENYELLKKSVEYLEKYGVPNSKLDTEYIFSQVLNVSRMQLTLNLNKKIDEKSKKTIGDMLVERGKNRRPLQYILGEWEFYGYPFKVDENVLIPRGDTEILVEQCKYLLQDCEDAKILDIGTGSGAIAISLGKEIPTSHILGVDISEGALEVATENRELNGADNVKFLKSDLFETLKADKYRNVKFDLIVSNPPYIPTEEYLKLMPEVLKYEPKNALTDGKDGLHFYKKISEEAGNFLKTKGYLAFEVGYNQAYDVSEIMKKNGFDVVAIVKDYGEIERVVIGRRKEEE